VNEIPPSGYRQATEAVHPLPQGTSLDYPTTPAHPAWERIRRFISPLISFVIFIVVALIIRRALADVSLNELIAELDHLSRTKIIVAVLCTIGGYAALVGYDWGALRYLQRALPLPLLALSSFCGCAVSNTAGWNLITGTSVRYRFYAAHGLTLVDATRVTLIAAMGYAFGMIVVGATALVCYPELLTGYTGIPPSWPRSIGAGMLAAAATFLALTFVRKEPLFLGRRKLRLPSGKIALSQLLFSVLDIFFTGACLYILLPEPPLPLLSFLAINAIGIAIGMLSHIPGGLGIFEGIVLLTLQDSLPTESIAAGLIVFRGIYYLAPLCIAGLILAFREVWERVWLKRKHPASSTRSLS
jgi:phosphatidylglycerol lysyltransferase